MPGQLSLWGGKRQRGRKPPPAPEFHVHCMVADTLRRWACPGLVWFHVPNEGRRSRRVNPNTGASYSPEAQRLARMGLRAGVADFLLVPPPNGLLHGLEVKRQGERPTQDQIDFGADLRAAGGLWDWTDNYDHAISILKRWGALQTTIHVI